MNNLEESILENVVIVRIEILKVDKKYIFYFFLRNT